MDQVKNNSNVKLVVVGESDVGKTCALLAYMKNQYVTRQRRPPSTTLPDAEVHDVYVPAQGRKLDVYEEAK